MSRLQVCADMLSPLVASVLYDHDPATGRLILHGMPLMLCVLCVLAIAYRYYSAFLAAKVAAFDDTRTTPAYQYNDGQNYHPTNRWVLFGHHFAAISGAGPLIGPVLALQYGYMPGLLWLVIGVTLAGAVQDMLVLAVSMRRDGKSLAEIARRELGTPASIVASLAILFIVIIALAGLGIIIVKALGGEEAKLPAGMVIELPAEQTPEPVPARTWSPLPQPDYRLPAGCTLKYAADRPGTRRPEAFVIRYPVGQTPAAGPSLTLPAGCKQVVAGSSWGTFTIACTIPIALLVGLWMYKLRPGKVTEASIGGAILVLAATIGGSAVPGSWLEPFFALTKEETVIALTTYGFITSVLPVWLLLGPRDYLSSFLKIGTIVLLVVGVLVANPPLPCPLVNETFLNGGPTFPGQIFPFVFICIMCGAISGFHSLVASGTTPKMIEKESHARIIGYGAMLMEGLVGVVALIAAASLPPNLYYDINVDLDRVPAYQGKLDQMYRELGVNQVARDPLHAAQVHSVQHLDLAQVEEMVGGESLRGRTGGAVTLAVGMSFILTDAMRPLGIALGSVLKYWYHFAIMFEALFILTTIDAGTRIARFLVQETIGKVSPAFARPDWLPGALLASAVVTFGWGALIWSGSIDTIWPMFGIANQLLAVLALTLVTTYLFNTGKGRYAAVTLVPLLFVCSTTLTAATQMILVRFPAVYAEGKEITAVLNISLTLFVIVTVGTVVVMAAGRWIGVALERVPVSER
jgi:carbon starvation protein